MSGNNNVTAAQLKMKKLKSRAKPSKRKRRINSEKHIEERDDEVPWPPPNETAIALYNHLIKADFKLTSLDEPRPIIKSASASSQKSFIQADRDLDSVHEKLDMLLGGQSKNTSTSIPLAVNPKPNPIEAAISEDVCTLFSQKCHIPPTGRVPLPPIGVFWDIENCAIPKGRSALLAVQRIRERFFPGHYEAEFVCVCDIRKESPGVIQELNDAQVSVVHVSGNSKNAADDKLRQAMRRFADVYCNHPVCPSSPFPATIILISGDINFSTDLSDLKHRKRLYVILLHNKHAPEALLLCAHEQYVFHSLLTNLPARPTYREYVDPNNKDIPLKGGLQTMDVLVCDLPYATSKTHLGIKNRLKKLSENCGGKVVTVQGQFGLVRFPNKEAALRASKRMNGEDVLGSKIRVLYSSEMEFQNQQIGSAAELPPPRNRDSSSGPPGWKPTWNKRSGEFGTSKSTVNRGCLNPIIPSQIPFQNSTATAPSNSSTSFDSSREGSPCPNSPSNRKQAVKTKPLNNSVQQPQSQTMLPSLNTNSAFAFHHNLFPMPQPSGMSLTSLEQTHQPSNDLLTTAPRLYSTSLSPEEDNVMQPSNGLLSTTQADISTPGPFSLASGVQASSVSHLLSTPSAPFQFGNSPVATMKPKSELDYFDLHVTNIDPSLGDWKIIRHTLLTSFVEHVGVKGIWVYVSGDGSVSSVVRVSNKEEAHYAVAQLHRKKLGNKRIFISFDQGGNIDQETLKKEVASLLHDVPGASLPLFKFREMFEKRYRRSVSSSDLYRMREVVAISENVASSGNASGCNIGRTISLSSEWKSKDDKKVSLYCSMHPPKRTSSEKSRTGWAEKEAEILLPNVIIELKVLSARVHSLLNSHGGMLPLISFMDCYEAEFGSLEVTGDGTGVPLEHLMSCVKSVEIAYSDNGMKMVKYGEKKEYDTSYISQPLATQLAQFGREMIDLLKTFPRCSLAFSKLIPAYHHHFGRQCRVADYGHFNLQSLLQAISHVIQIMGAAHNRILTLSHKAQMKRFATDLLRVLKAHGGAKKQIKVEDFSQAFSQVFPTRQFCPEDYGLCYVGDLITELVENSTLVALVKDEEGNQMLAVPKREQTPQEIHRTRIFASEVIELLRHSIRYEMPFSKFIPAYHHHFGRQCRVSDYGFSKLAELFESVSDTVFCAVPLIASDFNTDDRIIRLVPEEQVKVVGEQLAKMVTKYKEAGKSVKLGEVDELFMDEHGFMLRPESCDAECIDDLIVNKLGGYITVEDDGGLVVVDRNEIEILRQDVTAVLEQHPDFKMDLQEFFDSFLATYEMELDIGMIRRNLSDVLVVSDADQDGKRTVALAPLRIFAREISQLLEEFGGSLMVSNLEAAYLQKFGQPLRPAQMGYSSVIGLLQGIPDVIQVQGKHRAKRICLVGQGTSDTSSMEEGSRSQRPARSYRSQSLELSRNGHKQDGRWSDSPKRTVRRGAHLPPLYLPNMGSPAFSHGPAPDANVFTFERATPLSPPVYDMWMRDAINAGTPPCSPPVVWTYHPIVYPPSTPPATTGNILMPTHFSYGGPWSPPTMQSIGYETHAHQTGIGSEFIYDQQTRLAHGIERIGLDGRNEV